MSKLCSAAAAERGVRPRPVWLFAAWTLIWLAATAWLRPLMLPDEGRYVGVAFEMLRSGDWLTPTLNGLPYFHKPPLFYWITAASLAVFGPQEWAARLAPLIGALLAAVPLLMFVRRWAGPARAQASWMILLTQPLFFIGAQFANLDMLVAGCITATVLALAHAALSREQGHQDGGALYAAYGLAALGILAKGLIGAVLPAVVIGAWLVLRGRWRTLGNLLSWRGALIFAAITLPWFVAMQQRFSDFLHYFFVVQHVHRFAAGGFNNVQPFWFFPALLALAALPWWPWLFAAWRMRKAGHAGGDWGGAGTPSLPAVRLLMGVWLLGVVVFFSLPSSKLVGYVLPAVPALAFWLGECVVRWREQGRWRRAAQRGWVASLAVSAVVGLAIISVAALRPSKSSREIAQLLAQHHQPGQGVYMLGSYAFDLPFYAGLHTPVVVVDDWGDPGIKQRDNWRKELFDAGEFAPSLAEQLLITPAQWPSALCASRMATVHWAVGPAAAAAENPVLASAEQVGHVRGIALWRVDSAAPATAKALQCGETPSGALPKK